MQMKNQQKRYKSIYAIFPSKTEKRKILHFKRKFFWNEIKMQIEIEL